MNRMLLVGLLIVVGCASADPRDRVAEYSPEYPKNYIIVHDGTPGLFRTATCYDVTEATDRNAPFHLESRLRRLFAERVPQLPPCVKNSAWPRVTIIYRAGFGVCIHGCTDADPRSAYAFISLNRSAAETDQHSASAEWQYWRGGTAELTLQQFVFDFTNLYINALEKPPPNPKLLPE